MKLVKNGDTFETDDESFISAYKEAGYVEEVEVKEVVEKKTTKKSTK